MENLISNLIQTLPSYDSVDDNGNNIIHHLSQYGDLSLMRNVVKKNKIPLHKLLNQQNQDGNTPLHLAVGGGSQDLADYLVKKGCDSTICNFKGESCQLKNNFSKKLSGGGLNKEDNEKITGTRKI